MVPFPESNISEHGARPPRYVSNDSIRPRLLHGAPLPLTANKNERPRLVRRRADKADEGLEGGIRRRARPGPGLAGGPPVERSCGRLQPVA